MTASSTTLHESPDALSDAVRDRHRAIVSLMEELEAVDWYDQRIEAATDASLAAILRHNRDEEKEHAAMVLEWLRRHDPTWDAELRERLFTEGPIEAEDEGERPRDGHGGGAGADGSLAIGSLKAW